MRTIQNLIIVIGNLFCVSCAPFAAHAQDCPNLDDRGGWVGNSKPYVLQIDVCDGTVVAFTGDGGAQAKGYKMVGLKQCSLFNAGRDDDIGKKIVKTCPIGSQCHLEG